MSSRHKSVNCKHTHGFVVIAVGIQHTGKSDVPGSLDAPGHVSLCSAEFLAISLCLAQSCAWHSVKFMELIKRVMLSRF